MADVELELHIKRPIFSQRKKLLGILEIKIWRVRNSNCYPECYKYSFVFALYDETTGKFDGNFLRYDNHSVKNTISTLKEFSGVEKLLEDFRNDLKELLKEVEG